MMLDGANTESVSEISLRKEVEALADVVTDEYRTGERILCLDGGGIKGLNEIEMMKKIEEVSGRKIRDLFDWIGGTSTGGILALGIAIGKELMELEKLYWELKDQIFEGSEPYDCDKLESLLKKHFGEMRKMTDIKKPKVVVTGTLGHVFPPKLHLFRSYEPAAHQNRQLMYDIPYWVEVRTGDKWFAGTDANVHLEIHGEFGSTGKLKLDKSMSHTINQFEAGNTDVFSLMAPDIGEITKLTIGHDGSGMGSGWHLQEVMIKSSTRSQKFVFSVDKTLSTSEGLETTAILTHKQEELVWEAARSTSAAPKYFRHFGPYWDGGLVANNPTLDLLAEIQWHMRGSERGKPDICCVVSLGCGRVPESSQNVHDLVLPGSWTDIFKIPPLLDPSSIKSLVNFANIFLHQTTGTDECHFYRAMNWCRMMDVPFYRFSPKMKENIDLACTDDEKLQKMVADTKRYIENVEKYSENITKLAKLLTQFEGYNKQ